MCTVLVLHRVHPTIPLVIAGNRDEFYARAASGPTVLGTAPRVVGGRDLERGGTWLGVRPDGRFAVVTNQRDPRGNQPGLASRGQLLLDLLAEPDPDAMTARLATVDATGYNPFNLLYGDADQLRVGYGRRERTALALADVEPGLHVLPNDVLDAPDHRKVARARALVEPHARAPWPELGAALWRALGDHDRPALAEVATPPTGSIFSRELVRELGALCIHTPAYGTRSSTLLALAPGEVVAYEVADGPPCQTAPTSARELVLRP